MIPLLPLCCMVNGNYAYEGYESYTQAIMEQAYNCW